MHDVIRLSERIVHSQLHTGFPFTSLIYMHMSALSFPISEELEAKKFWLTYDVNRLLKL